MLKVVTTTTTTTSTTTTAATFIIISDFTCFNFFGHNIKVLHCPHISSY
jgi:hypothetical protein